MKYSELLELYKQGKLEESKRKTIEKDIDRHRAISEYLVDEMEADTWEIDFSEKNSYEPDRNFTVEKTDFTKQIHKSIRKAFVKMGAIVTAIILCVVLFCMFGLSPLVSRLYYNPGKEVGEYNNQMSLDWSVYSELSKPGLKRDSIVVNNEGFGEYSITIAQTVTYTGKFSSVSGMVKRGKIQLYSQDVVQGISSNYFACCQLDSHKSVMEQEDDEEFIWMGINRKEAANEIDKLDEEAVYTGYVTFNNIIDFQELSKIMREEEIVPEWCGVCTEDYDYGNYFNELIGFSMDFSGSIFSGGWDEQKYPNLKPWDRDFLNGNSQTKMEEKYLDEEWCTSHLNSMLKYVIDNPTLADTFGIIPEEMSSIRKYIDKNGLKFYGIVVLGNREEFIRLNNLEEVYGIYTEEIR